MKLFEINVLILLQIFESVISWIKYDKKNRADLFTKLLKYIKFSRIPMSVLNDQIKNHKFIESNYKCNFYLKVFTHILSIT